MTQEAVRPCPFCGRTDLLGVEAAERGYLAVKCRACGAGAGGARSETPREAIAAWNRRAQGAAPTGEAAIVAAARAWGDADVDDPVATLAAELALAHALAGSNAEGPKPDGWLDIRTAPKIGVFLLGLPIAGSLREGDRRVYEGRWSEDQQTFTSANGFIVLTGTTHWQPLPAPPSSSQEGG